MTEDVNVPGEETDVPAGDAAAIDMEEERQPMISARAIGALPDIIALASNRSTVRKVFIAADLPEASAVNAPPFKLPEQSRSLKMYEPLMALLVV